MDFMGLFLGACTVLVATSVGAAGVLALKRIDSRFYATLVAFCAGVMGFSALEMIGRHMLCRATAWPYPACLRG